MVFTNKKKALASVPDVDGGVVVPIVEDCAFGVVTTAQASDREVRRSFLFGIRFGGRQSFDATLRVDLFARSTDGAARRTCLNREPVVQKLPTNAYSVKE